MTTNSYIFAWDMTGIESIIPITQYEGIDAENTLRILKNESPVPNPLTRIIHSLILRARANSHRHYEIYAIDCAFDIDEVQWRAEWEENPQGCADLIRERGVKLYSDRATRNQVIF